MRGSGCRSCSPRSCVRIKLVRPAEGIDEFFAAPAGTFLSGRNWLYLCVDEKLFGQIHWGVPDVDDVARLLALWDVELRPEVLPHASFVDTSALEGMRSDWFELMRSELQRNWQGLTTKIERQAVVRPSGLVGAMVAGFFDVLTPPYEVKVFERADAALEWLGRPELADELRRLADDTKREEPLLRALREHLAGSLGDAALPKAARALGVSERTLQRRLQEAGTAFQTEVQRARVHAAEQLLTDPELKLTAIALEVGCASLQHFSTLFQRVNGLSPRQWRERRR
jgi:AraC-like DNA-binding protein